MVKKLVRGSKFRSSRYGRRMLVGARGGVGDGSIVDLGGYASTGVGFSALAIQFWSKIDDGRWSKNRSGGRNFEVRDMDVGCW